MIIESNKLEELVISKKETAKKTKVIAIVVSIERHEELVRLTKKYKLTQGEIINLVLDDYMEKQ